MRANTLGLLALVTAAVGGSDLFGQEGALKPGIPGPVLNFQVPVASAEAPPPAAQRGNDIGMVGMARWALNYLLRSPRPHLNYQPVFQCAPLGCPPFLCGDSWDHIVDGDTDSRMDWEFYYMRDITGSRAGLDIEKAFHKRIRGYLGKYDLCWLYAGCLDMPPQAETAVAKGKMALVWTTCKLLKSLALSYERTGDAEDKKLARRVFEGLRAIAVRSGDCAWMEGGMGPLDAQLKAREPGSPGSGWNAVPAPIIDPLVCYWLACRDEEALDLARAFAEGHVQRATPAVRAKVNDDGSFIGHSTVQHALWGIGHLGVALQEPRYIEFVRSIYEFLVKHGTGTGWTHEAIVPETDSGCDSGETCATSDLVSLAGYLAQASAFMPDEGYAAYYDHLERYLRNYIAPVQFFITPAFEAEYRSRHSDKPAEMVEAGLADLRKMEGGFLGGVGINDFMNDFAGDMRMSYALCGCCAPEGMRALHTVWANVVRVRPGKDGAKDAVFVNMSLGRETPEVEVISHLPDRGGMTVRVRGSRTGPLPKYSDFYLRPPAWAPKETVAVWRGKKRVKPAWSGAYIVFEDSSVGEELAITYPLVTYEQRVAIWTDESKVATFSWKGNTAIAVDPPGNKFPLYTGAPPVLPPGPNLPE